MNRLLQNGGRSDWQLRDAEAILARARLVSVARLRLYARNGRLVLDSTHMDRSARVIAKSLPPMPGDDTMPGLMQNLMKAVTSIWRDPTPLLSEINAADGLRLTEVTRALRGQPASAQRQSEEGGDILTVAVPVQGYRAVVGALMVSTQPGEIDALLAEERQLIFQLSAIALVVNIITSLLLAATMVVPVRRLAAAMRGFGSTSPSLPGLETIPDLSHRRDEIAELSGALRDMTERLLSRINTIDRFAADVARGQPTAVTLACADAARGDWLASHIGAAHFRPYLSDDIIGAEIGGAIKNVLAIACGIVMGKGLGESARAAITARGFVEMSRLGVALGAQSDTLTSSRSSRKATTSTPTSTPGSARTAPFWRSTGQKTTPSPTSRSSPRRCAPSCSSALSDRTKRPHCSV